jgi:hypothetical protein
MAPHLTEPPKREVELDGQLYTVTLGPKGVYIAPKGKRKGHELLWRSLASGEAELNRDLVPVAALARVPCEAKQQRAAALIAACGPSCC